MYILKQAVYRMGEPSQDAHQRMKMAMCLRGKISSPRVRPPLSPLPDAIVAELRRELEKAGLLREEAAAARR